MTIDDLRQLSRPGFVEIIDTLEEFHAAEALEHTHAWQQAAPSKPAGICGPIGQLPLVARMVNAMGLKLHNCHFWGMDERGCRRQTC